MPPVNRTRSEPCRTHAAALKPPALRHGSFFVLGVGTDADPGTRCAASNVARRLTSAVLPTEKAEDDSFDSALPPFVEWGARGGDALPAVFGTAPRCSLLKGGTDFTT